MDAADDARSYARDVLLRTLKVLTSHGVLLEQPVSGNAVWAIPESAVLVTSEVAHLRCNHHGCNHSATIARAEADRWRGAPCPRPGCTGALERAEEGESDYYSALYRRGELSRVIPAEHSALVEASERERIEQLFSADERDAAHKPWHPNLGSSTPTLEMGIDIGDLSATILTRVPPRPANYVQRIGRSGRKSGSALNLTVATGRPHDLYFMNDPRSMIAAEIEPPGLFLNAPYVLKRQLLAFAFDSWVSSGVSEESVPGHVQQALDAAAGQAPADNGSGSRAGQAPADSGSGSRAGQAPADSGSAAAADAGVFPWNFLEYVATHGDRLQRAFLSRFAEEELDAYSRQYLGELLQAGRDGPELTREILERLGGLREEIHSLKRRLQTINNSLHELEEKSHLDSSAEERRDDLKRQQRALEVIISRLQKKNTFQFLTDEGLVPNFSFPEAGVVLRSVILRRSKRNTEVGEPQVYEYQRPAMAALSELAPEAEFYGQGRKVTIQQIDLRTSEIEQWRICDTCHHMEPEATGAQYTTCPRCESPQWSDVGRKQNLLKMKQVVAVEPDWKSRSYDEKEERTPTFFSRNLFVDVDPREITAAQVMDAASLPFGFEFVRNVTLRDLNFGRMNSSRSSFRFGGMEVSAGGFHICRHCGAVLAARNSGGEGGVGFGSVEQHREVNHAAWCPVHTGESEEGDAFSAVFLYRDYRSEAIRLLIPTELFAVERQLESFVAALFLDLRDHFGGSVDHISSTHMYLPGADGGPTEHFLVLYDSVPGGTGYLKQLLADSDSGTGTGTLRAVFEHSLRSMQACPCEDGCHRCVYSYRQAHVMERISKQTAIALFSRVVDNWHTLADAHGSVAGHSGNAWLESRLEATFVQALHAVPEALGLPVALHGSQVRGKAGWTLTVNGNTYQVEPQARIGFTDSVTPPITPDFMIRPVNDQTLSRPIAVFTDGFAFHGDIERGPLAVGSDAHKRIAIRESGRYWVWSLTYDDVVTALMPDTGSAAASTFLVDPTKLERASALVKNKNAVDLAKQGSFYALIGILAYPDERAWKRIAVAAGVALGSNGGSVKLSRGLGERAWITANLDETFAEGRSDVTNQEPQLILRNLYPGERWIAAAAVWPFGDLQEEMANPGRMRGILTLRGDESSARRAEFKGAWNAFWNAVNLLQLLPGVRWGTTSTAPTLDTRWGREAGDEDSVLSTVLELIPDADIRELVRMLDHEGFPLPEPGFELADSEDVIVAEAELAWKQRSVALVLAEEVAVAVRAAGWTVYNGAPDSVPGGTIIAELKGALA